MGLNIPSYVHRSIAQNKVKLKQRLLLGIGNQFSFYNQTPGLVLNGFALVLNQSYILDQLPGGTRPWVLNLHRDYRNFKPHHSAGSKKSILSVANMKNS